MTHSRHNFALSLIVASWVAAIAVGCSSEEQSSSESCIEGRSVACSCTNGGNGSQVCTENGTWGPCRCAGDADSDTEDGPPKLNPSDPDTDRAGGDSGSPSSDAADDAESDVGPAPIEAPFEPGDGFADSSWLENADLDVVKVTNLDDSGEGSLPWALDQNGPKVVVFEVGGEIDMGGQTYLRSREPETYIAGQTAPSPGITINRGGIRVHGDKTIIRHIRVRVGDEIDDPGKARSFTYDDGVADVILDHVSASWHLDQGVGVRDGVENSTIMNSLIAEGLCYSTHPEQPHCRGILISYDSKNVASLGNVYSHHERRHPYAQGGSEFVWVNNYIYNHGYRLAHLGSGSKSDIPPVGSFVGNVYEMGADSPELEEEPILIYSGTVYYEDNVSVPPGRPATGDSVTLVDDPPLWPDGLSAISSDEVQTSLLETAGARPADRTDQDRRMIEDIENGEGSWVDSQEEVGGYPTLESTDRTLDVPDTNLLDWLEQHARAVEDPNVDPPE